MLLKTIMNRLQRFKGFVYEQARFVGEGSAAWIEVHIRPRAGSKPRCGNCGRPGSKYGFVNERRYQFVPLWGIATFLVYRPRRVECHRCRAVTVELVPWARGKERQALALQLFLSHWAKKLSWKQVAMEFRVSWNSVFRALKCVVSWGLENRSLAGITAIGVDELMIWKGHRYVTLVYQIDAYCKRLLWIGKDRSRETFERCFDELGKQVCESIRYVCSDMWKLYLAVIRRRLQHVVHIVDRFHVVAYLNRQLELVRAQEARRFRAKGSEVLKDTRWCILKKPSNLTRRQRGRLSKLLSMNLKTVRAYLLVRDFRHFWEYTSATWAAKFLNSWCSAAIRSRIGPLKKGVKMLRKHSELILNWFRAKKSLSSGVVEALNNNAKLTIRKAYGFKSFATLQVALFHALGDLPEPQVTNKFW
jgi:transposase